jgi:hypothetical protein
LPDPQTQDIKTRNIASKIKERRDESRKWMDANFYGELAEVFLANSCKTEPIMVADATGKQVEDTTRTNVCMPTISLVVRKNVARLTANDPNIKYRCSSPDVADKLNAWAYLQFDRSGEKREHRRHVMQAEMFGFSYTKLSWDTVVQNRVFRKDRSTYTDRSGFMQEQGAPEDEIKQAVDQLGPNLSPDEINQAVAQHGSEIEVPQSITKYDGPTVRCIFDGDFFMPPGVLTLNDADWWVEQYDETDLWLQKKAKVQYKGRIRRVDTGVQQESHAGAARLESCNVRPRIRATRPAQSPPRHHQPDAARAGPTQAPHLQQEVRDHGRP